MKRKRHGYSRERLYSIWNKMLHRCEDITNCHYGGRGISVCDEWRGGDAHDISGYEKFKEWSLRNGYEDNLEIDRIDNDGNYCPENCRWADRLTQVLNRSNTLYYEYDGKNIPIRDIIKAHPEIPKSRIYRRAKAGQSYEDILKPYENGRMYDYVGKRQSITAWAREYGMDSETLRRRLQNGIPFEKALTAPIDSGLKKPVRRIDCETGETKEYPMIKAVKEDAFDTKSVITCCKGKKDQYRGYKWEYIVETD